MTRAASILAATLGGLLFSWMSNPVCAQGRASDPPGGTGLTLQERLADRLAVEQVYWRHRIWPGENPSTKPRLDSVLGESALRAKVLDTLRKTRALEAIWHRPVVTAELQAEIDRFARDTRDPRLLEELFDALDGDAYRIAETLARPTLVDRLIRERFSAEGRANSFAEWWAESSPAIAPRFDIPAGRFTLPAITQSGCTPGSWAPTRTDFPDARVNQTAVWTGTEMIVWGGSLTTPYMNSGGRYNPATDTWAPTSLGANVPEGRIRHTAVWTGTEMIVWGGIDYDGTTRVLNTGGRYDPVTDTWVPTSISPYVPAARSQHVAVWTGTEMIVWGGNGTNTGDRYNPSTDSWTPTSTGPGVPVARSWPTAVWTGTEMIVWGGLVQNTGGRYNPATNTWVATSTGPGVPTARANHVAVWTGSEMIVWGGDTGGGLNTGGRYDPLTNSWTATSVGANVPAGRYYTAGVWTGSRMLIWGGLQVDSHQVSHYLDSGGLYDPSTNSWASTSAGSNVPVGRDFHTAVWTGSEMIVWGGFVGGATYYPRGGGRYNPATDTWAPTSTGTSVPVARSYSEGVWTGAEMLVWGGWNDSLGNLNSGGRYDPALDSWTPSSTGLDCPAPGSYNTAVWTGTELIVWGGTAGNGGSRYNPVTDTWKKTSTGANVPAARSSAAVVWTGTEMIVWGGAGAAGFFNTGARYNPVSDTWLPTSTGTNVPSARYIASAVWTGSEMIVWGGKGPGPSFPLLNTGGRYNPASDTWSPVSTGVNVPSLRSSFSSVWTGTEMIIWGGGDATSYNDGGRYNPSTNSWAPVPVSAGVPAPRSRHSALWTGSDMLVWGGALSGGSRTNTGARYSPSAGTWTPTATGPDVAGPRGGHSAVLNGTEMIVWGGDVPTSTGALYCACSAGIIVYRDADADGYGTPASSQNRCDGSIPAGYVTSGLDCDDASGSSHPGATESCNGLDDDCNGLVDDDFAGVDSDADGIRNLCDDCPVEPDPAQADADQDGQGDVCDLDDGIVWEWRSDAETVSWQAEQGVEAWNVYFGDLDELRSTGVYTQVPGSTPLARRQCGVSGPVISDDVLPDPGKVSYSLVAPVVGGLEGSLGSSTAGERPNHNPCP